ncbi:hypothetical protein RhiirC2_828439 [Rhizophagus irregularis]|uniref:Putative restriction endonuclease domain-containing protein n=1 Tax=Rhizophagus irregularis TaxID=588596 RepID=A0A2N1NBL4_9GLOM|nr:hypothetical protein RhiirC2_828439 [Rhizophagus irregularis]
MTQKRKLIEPLASENSASKRKKFTDSGNSASKRKKFADSRKKFDINEIDFNRTYNLEEFEFIKDHIKDNYPNFEFVNGKLVPVSYSPIVYEAIVHEISRQLGNWNINNSKNGVVTTSKGGFDFNVSGGQKIRAPDVTFTPANIYRSLDEEQLWSFNGQPFTPFFVVEVANLKKKEVDKEIDTKFKKEYFAIGTSVELGWLIDPLNRIIQVYKRNKNGEPYRRKRPWVYLEGGKHLPGFTLELWPIDDIIAQEINYEDDSSEEEDEEECPYCNASIKGASQMDLYIYRIYVI